MKYMGSKSRIAKYIVPILQKYIDECDIDTYIEPFVGGANIIDQIKCDTRMAIDNNHYLIALFQHLQKGGELYKEVSKELYDRARDSFMGRSNEKFDDWEIGNIGFLASYNGRFFDGGYGKPVYEKTKNGVRYRDYYAEGKKNLLKQSDDLSDVMFTCSDYKNIRKDLRNTVIYCDPPYNDTKRYKNAVNFDYEEFWDIVRELSEENIVIVSELNAPDDFEVIWEKLVSRSIKVNDKSKAVEKLFKYRQYKRLFHGGFKI